MKIHLSIIAILYSLGFMASSLVVSYPEAQKDLITLLSAGAIFATFGSAIGAIGLIWQSDLLERLRLNIDIFYRDITKQETPWRRWPFLSRSSRRKLINGESHRLTLNNPVIPLDVGTHIIKVDLPTVAEDFFDLPLISNYWRLLWYRKSAHTLLNRKKMETVSENTGMGPYEEYMAYECMLDIWRSILKYRLARYAVHFGSGLTIFGSLTVAFHLASRLYV